MSGHAKLYRLYVDESGTHSYPKGQGDGEKCLGLTGIAISREEYGSVLQPRLKQLKLLFTDDLDDLPIFHREEMVKRLGHFKKLADPVFEAEFNSQYLQLLTDLNFKICCVVIDKERHKNTYAHPAHPYNYCMSLLVEKYTGFLLQVEGRGDVMAESRGGNEDMQLKNTYERFYSSGTFYRDVTKVQKVLTSKELKLKKKKERIEGVELADLLAIPTKIHVLHTYRRTDPKDNFNKQIIEVIQGKYYENWLGTVKGYGMKLI